MFSVRYWKFDEIIRLLMGIFGCLSFFLVLQMLTSQLLGKARFAEGTFLYILFSSLSLHGSVLLGTGGFLFWNRITWGQAFGFWNGKFFKVIGLAILISLLFLPVGMLMQAGALNLLENLHFKTHPQVAVDEFNQARSVLARVYLSVFAIVIAPVAEEILFRGLFFRGLAQIFHRWAAFLISAALFAAIHASLPIFFPLMLFGVLLAWLYERTNNLFTPIIAHGLFNAINIALLYADTPMGSKLHSK